MSRNTTQTFRNLRICHPGEGRDPLLLCKFEEQGFKSNRIKKRDAVVRYLKERNYIISPVSIDNDDWKFSRKFTRAIKNKESKKASKIGKEFLAHMKERTQYFEKLSEQKLGRNIKHILLIHMNQLNYKYLDELLTWYTKQGWKYITLKNALEDPAYGLRDQYLGKWGISWLERIML